jgi:hypothetical protein
METGTMRNLRQRTATIRARPSTLAALERRWFVGRKSIAAAEDAHNALDQECLSDPMLGNNLVLIGTSAMLELAQLASAGDSNPNVTVHLASDPPGWCIFTLSVPVGLRGRNLATPNKLNAGDVDKVIRWKTNGATMGKKQYYVRNSVVEAARRHIFHIAKGPSGGLQPVVMHVQPEPQPMARLHARPPQTECPLPNRSVPSVSNPLQPYEAPISTLWASSGVRSLAGSVQHLPASVPDDGPWEPWFDTGAECFAQTEESRTFACTHAAWPLLEHETFDLGDKDE